MPPHRTIERYRAEWSLEIVSERLQPSLQVRVHRVTRSKMNPDESRKLIQDQVQPRAIFKLLSGL